jgi:hypothetical protein
MMMRSDFEISGYKQMKVKEMDRMAGPRLPAAGSARRRAEARPGFGAALLGAACVVAVFAVLGLLYSLG